MSNSPPGSARPEPQSNDPRTLIEEIACGIADAQAALFAGRFRDLERCILRQQELCALLKTILGDDYTNVASAIRGTAIQAVEMFDYMK